MTRQIFINLPVRDVENSRKFFDALGFGFNRQCTNDDATCLVVTGDISVMLLSHDHFKKFTKKEIVDTFASTELLLCLTCQSREKVDEMVSRAVGSGGRVSREPEDRGFMYGHTWELVYREENRQP